MCYTIAPEIQTPSFTAASAKSGVSIRVVQVNLRDQRIQEIEMNTTFNRMAILTLLGAFAMNIAACNTVNGVGKDMQKAGKEVSEEAKEHTDKD